VKLPAWSINPIVVKELRSRMRGWRAFAVLTSVLLIMAGISYLFYRIVLAATRYSTMPVSPQIGQAVFVALAVVELLMICFVTPAVTAGSISGEQEKLTYEMLLATPLRPASILWGKLISALSYVFLLILAGVPMASLVFIFGGMSPVDMVKSMVILVATAITLGVVGVFMSVAVQRTVRATVLSYLVVLALLVGPLLAYIFVGVLRQSEPPRWLLVPNPISALFSALAPSLPSNSGGVLSTLVWGLGGRLWSLTGSMSMSDRIPRPLYHYTLPLYGLLSLALYLVSTRLVRTARRWRLRWREVLAGLGLLVALAGVVAVPFLLTSSRYEWFAINATPTPMVAVPPRAVSVPVVVEVPVGALPTVTPAPTEPPSTPLAGTATPAPLPPPSGAGSSSDPSWAQEDMAEIYAAVVRQLYTVDHTFGEPPNFPTVYLVRITDDHIADPNVPQGDPAALPEAVQASIVARLADLPAEFKWVDSDAEVARDDTGTVAGRGAIVTLGNVHLNEDGQAMVSARLYFAMLGMGARTYLLERVEGAWQVVGDTGVQIMS
jgi:ABC-2 type transport system permease protein